MIQVTEDDSNNITIIHQKYFEKGHNESEVDSIHSTLDTASTDVEIYHPNEWDVIRRNARVKQPYKIFNLSQDDEVPVYNLKQFCKPKIINRIKYEDDNGKVVDASWKNAQVITYSVHDETSIIDFSSYDEILCSVDTAKMPGKVRTRKVERGGYTIGW